MGTPPLVLTLKLDRGAYGHFEKLRQRYFPKDRNLVPAHVTLFHALPGDRELSLAMAMEKVCLQTPLLNLSFDKVRFLGRGVAIEVNSPGLLKLRNGLAAEWEPWLTAQDKQSYRPHITIQNKV
ncbi:MAG: 2'-5' RNA ligase family protein, partial [bacterium]|nr:2'-5' RNA ligase family protein [bacterium]